MNNVEFLGYKRGLELIDLVKNAYFVIVPSEWYENNPMTIIEAYSVGTPVIGAKIGGIPEIIIDGKQDINSQQVIVIIYRKLSKNIFSDSRSISKIKCRNVRICP